MTVTKKLSERTMLVTLHLSAYAGMMADAEVTAAANEAFGAEAGAGRYGKKLIAGRFLNDVSNAHNSARRTHKALTLPWQDDGTRILTTAGFLQYQQRMKTEKAAVEEAVKLFVDRLPDAIDEAKVRLKGMFKPEDYPSAEELKGKFGFDIEYKSMPEAGDFRAQLSDEQTKHIIKDIEKRSKARVDRAMNDVWERILEMVGQLSTKLKDFKPAENGDKPNGSIRAANLYGIHEFAKEMMPILNITEDDRMDKLRVELMTDLMSHSPEILRSDTKARKETISKADAILKKVKQYMA